MTACGATTRDVHGNAVCDLDADHPGGHNGEVMTGIRLSWAAAPPLSPEEREIVERFENAGDPYEGDCRLCGRPSDGPGTDRCLHLSEFALCNCDEWPCICGSLVTDGA